MRKLLLLLLFPLFSLAQVGINTTTPNASSMLDITATDKGLLIPRISIPNLNAAAPVTSPATSLMVYNTNATTGVGYYYWDGAKWTPFGGGVSHWTKVGNDIYNNNTGNVGVGTTSPTTKFHVENTTGATVSAFLDGFEDNTIAPFTTSGTGGSWTTTSAAGQFNAGAIGAKSGSGVTSGVSTMNLSVTIPTGGSPFSFNYRVDSEANYDYLRFYIDGVQQSQWSGTVAWATYSGTLTAGVHTLSWKYEKDSSGNTGLDAAFIDQVSITNTTVVQPAIRIVDGSQGSGKVLMSDANGNATWQLITNSSISDIPNMASVQGMEIPICNNYSSGSTGSFNVTIKGVPTTVNWTIQNKQIKSGTATVTDTGGTTRTVALAPITAERLQVKYDFSPQLPFNPLGIIFNAYNDSGYPDTFIINYAASSQSSITVNIARGDLFASTTSNCWQGQFYFDVFMTN